MAQLQAIINKLSQSIHLYPALESCRKASTCWAIENRCVFSERVKAFCDRSGAQAGDCSRWMVILYVNKGAQAFSRHYCTVKFFSVFRSLSSRSRWLPKFKPVLIPCHKVQGKISQRSDQ